MEEGDWMGQWGLVRKSARGFFWGYAVGVVIRLGLRSRDGGYIHIFLSFLKYSLSDLSHSRTVAVDSS